MLSTGDETATDDAPSGTYDDQMWTAGAGNTIAFREIEANDELSLDVPAIGSPAGAWLDEGQLRVVDGPSGQMLGGTTGAVPRSTLCFTAM